MIRFTSRIGLVILALGCAVSSQAADVVFGNTLPLSGPLGPTAKLGRMGIEAYIARVNREGGIGGGRVVLRTMDDAYQVDRFVGNVDELLNTAKVDAIIAAVGTAHIEAAYPKFEQAKRPLIGAFTGGSALRRDGRGYIYHVRASYADEVRRLVEQVATVSQSRIYAVWQDDGLGRDAMAALENALRGSKVRLVGQQAMKLSAIDGAAVAGNVIKSGADALFLLCVNPCAGSVLASLPSEGRLSLSPYALSIVDGESLADKYGPAAFGTVISQVMPNPRLPTTPLVRRYQQDMAQAFAEPRYSYLSLESYVATMVAVEAARVVAASGGKRSMDEVMKQMIHREFFGIPVSSGGTRGVRPHPVTLSMIGKNGKLIH